MAKRPLGPRGKGAVALAATGIAGCVDAACWLLLFHVYVANMTGNFLAVGIGGLSHDVGHALRGGLAVSEFFVGAVVGRLLLRSAERTGFASAASVSLGLEVLLLGLFLAVSPHGLGRPGSVDFYLRAALPALAMGAQNVTLRHVGPLSFYTTHVTGTVTRLAESISDALSWDRRRPDRRRDLLRAGFMAGLLGFYASGAVLGVWLEHEKGRFALAIPAAALVLLIGLDQVRPLLQPPRPSGPQPAKLPDLHQEA